MKIEVFRIFLLAILTLLLIFLTFGYLIPAIKTGSDWIRLLFMILGLILFGAYVAVDGKKKKE